jgi:hypothetical protein
MFLGLPDPDLDPLVRGMDQDTSLIKQNSKKNLDSYCFVISFGFVISENDVNVPSKSNKQKTYIKKFFFFVDLLEVNDENRGSGSAPGYGSAPGFICQRHGSANPDPHQNVMDPEYCFLGP